MAKAEHLGRVLVVDDEPSIVDSVSTVLRYEGFDVDVAHTGRSALAKSQEGRYDLVVLDVMLPDLDGLEVTRRLRQDGVDIPVLFLTAKADVEDRVAGLSIGGDDYVTKPFSLIEVVARAKAILRRRKADDDDRTLCFSDLEMHEESHQVWRGGKPLHLTATEFNLLRLFLLNPRPCALEGSDHRPCLALRLRRKSEHCRNLCAVPAQEARRPRSAAHPHDPPRRICDA